ncbi:MAG TPA: thioredoxin domain-containing protein [Polyangiaceae bacterium]|nr:thioredoxin domain-containing protein [Polyangiaceae bacterium]
MKPSPVSAHDHVDGPADAPITLIEYGDYECPFCVKAYPVLESIRQTFRGKLRFVYRHVPKSAAQGFAKQAAEASEFAAANGKFWAMHGELFANDNQHDLEQLVHCATKVGLDGAACRKALLERTFAARVRELSVASVRSGIIGTPTLFINDTHYENRLEEPLLEAAIRRELEAPAT